MAPPARRKARVAPRPASVLDNCDLLIVPDLVRRGILDRLVMPNLAGAARASNVPVLMIGSRAVEQSRGSVSWAFSPASLPEGPEGRIAIHNGERALR